MSDFVLAATKRDTSVKAGNIRNAGSIPAVLYGHKVTNEHLAIPYSKFVKVYSGAGTNILVDLKIGEREPVKVLIHDVDHDVVSNKVRHVDLYQVRMDEKIHAEIPVHFTGESPAVKSMGGTLVTQIAAIPVECYPKDLIKYINIDLASLVDFDSAIRIKDVVFGSTIDVLKDADDVIASVVAPRVETEETPEEAVEGEEEGAGEVSEDGSDAEEKTAPEGAAKKEDRKK